MKRRPTHYSDRFGHDCDEIVYACVQSVAQMIQVGRPEPYSIKTTVESGLRHWFALCRDHVNAGAVTLALGSIDKRTIEAFIACARRLPPSDDFFRRIPSLPQRRLRTVGRTSARYRIANENASVRRWLWKRARSLMGRTHRACACGSRSAHLRFCSRQASIRHRCLSWKKGFAWIVRVIDRDRRLPPAEHAVRAGASVRPMHGLSAIRRSLQSGLITINASNAGPCSR